MYEYVRLCSIGREVIPGMYFYCFSRILINYDPYYSITKFKPYQFSTHSLQTLSWDKLLGISAGYLQGLNAFHNLQKVRSTLEVRTW